MLVDCLTLWINNLLYEAEQAGRAMEESDIQKHCEAVLRACAPLAGTVIFVTNEVGWGIIPENALGAPVPRSQRPLQSPSWPPARTKSSWSSAVCPSI